MTTTHTSIQNTYLLLKGKLEKIMPDFEIKMKAEIAWAVNQLKREKNAVILGHNYMEPALYHSVPDFHGDSLGLSRLAAKTTKDIIVFLGVEFMAETAKVLNPSKKVLIPSQKAGCSLAESISAEILHLFRQNFAGVPIVAYINTYADIKALVDYCCTSGNALKLLKTINNAQIIFIPDQYLANNMAIQMGLPFYLASFDSTGKVQLKDSQGQSVSPNSPGLIGWSGKCEVHELFKTQDIKDIISQFPDVHVLAHPECSPEVCKAAHFSGSTTQMITHVKQTSAKKFLLLTECSMADNIISENPQKEILRLCSHRCPHMAQITLENTYESLKNEVYEVEIPVDIRKKAKVSIDRMLAINS